MKRKHLVRRPAEYCGYLCRRKRDHTRESSPGAGSGFYVFLQGHFYGPNDPESLCQILKNYYNICHHTKKTMLIYILFSNPPSFHASSNIKSTKHFNTCFVSHGPQILTSLIQAFLHPFHERHCARCNLRIRNKRGWFLGLLGTRHQKKSLNLYTNYTMFYVWYEMQY